MAPSVQQLPEETPVPSIEKLAITQEVSKKTTEEASGATTKEATKAAPKVKRQIDLEGGKTDAKV